MERNTAEEIRHFEAAAMQGHAPARFNLVEMEASAKNYDIALQHWMIAASLGHQEALNGVEEMPTYELPTKAEK